MDFSIIAYWFAIVIILILIVYILKFHVFEKFSAQTDELKVPNNPIYI